MNPASPDDSSNAVRETRREARWLLLFALAMIGGGAAFWLAFPHLSPAVKGWLGRRHLPTAHEAMQKRDWAAAASALRAARRWSPEDPAVIHASIDVMMAANGDPRTVISLVRQLRDNGHATSEDLALMGRLHAVSGQPGEGRAIYETLPAADRGQPEALLLQAALLAAEGKRDDAVEVRRAALLVDLDRDPSILLRLAAIDLTSSDPTRREDIRARLWKAAREAGDLALPAIDLIAGTKDLTAPQAGELLKLIDAHPDQPEKKIAVRLRVLSAQMRVSPHLRTDILQQELTRWTHRSPAEAEPLVNWLAAEREYARLLRLVPAATATRYTELLPGYVAALRAEKRWDELDRLLQPGKIDAAFPVQRIRLWRAEARWHLDGGDVSQARQNIAQVLEDSGRGENAEEALEAGHLAESLHLWDLAQRCYQAVITRHARLRPSLLPKIYELAELQHDGGAMLQACREMLALQPDSTAFQLQQLYLQMLIGSEIELASQRLQNMAVTGPAERTDLIHLLHALAAYRQGRAEDMLAAMPKIIRPEGLPPGQRTVYAALLKLTKGDASRVFQLIERVPPLLLLPEEKSFLQRAL